MLGLFPARPGIQLADAREMRRLVNDLPAMEPAAALENAGAKLDSLVVGDGLRAEQRLDVIVQIDDAVVAQTRRLARDFLTASGQNRTQEFKLWSQNHDYWLRLIGAYEDVLRRHREHEKGAEGLKARLPQLCVRLLGAYAGRLKWEHFRYGPIGQEIWAGAGAVYRLAVEGRFERKPVPMGGGNVSAEAEYLRLLLVHASSMDNLLPVEIEIAERLVTHLLPYFHLTNQVHPDNVYWVDVAKPLPPTRLARLPEITPTLWFFGTRAALDAIHNLRLKLESTGELPADINFGGQYPVRAVLPVVEHLAACWAPKPPMRGHQRHRVKSWLSVVNGLETVFQRVSGQRGRDDEAWVAENVSLNGIGANVSLIGKDWLRVGALVGMQPDGGGNWLVGIVRRLVRESESLASVGLETLSKASRAAIADSGGRQIPVLILDPLANGSETRVVMPDWAWDTRLPLKVAVDGRKTALQPVAVADAGAGHIVGRYKAA